MKRMFYVSRFARALSPKDMEQIHESAVRYNRAHGITGVLVSLGRTFFQVLEGRRGEIDCLYRDRILLDERHTDVLCLKSEMGVRKRMFPRWDMRVFNLNEEREVLPLAFREMLAALMESSHALARYTQPGIFKMLEQGINPSTVKPRRKQVTVLFSDIVGFTRFAERLKPAELIDLVNSHAEVCVDQVDASGGQVNKLLGDGVMAYFHGSRSDDALKAAMAILEEMSRRRQVAGRRSPHRLLFGGVGLASGMVYEGNIGPRLKNDFTILGNTVNRAARLESQTRDLNVRLTLGAEVCRRAEPSWTFRSLGHVTLKGQSRPTEVFTMDSLDPLDVAGLYRDIDKLLRIR